MKMKRNEPRYSVTVKRINMRINGLSYVQAINLVAQLKEDMSRKGKPIEEVSIINEQGEVR